MRYIPAAFLSASFMRSCQPGPPSWKCSSTSRSMRNETSSLECGTTGFFGGASSGLVVATLKAASAAWRGSLPRRDLSPDMVRPLSSERPRHHFLAAQILLLEQLARHRRFEAVGRMARHVPAARPAGEVAPVLGRVRHVGRLVHLLHLGRVFGDEAVRLDEISEDVVARAVAADAPLDVEAVLLHPTGAAHQPVEIWHLIS